MGIKRLWCWAVGHDWWHTFEVDFFECDGPMLHNEKSYCGRCGMKDDQ